jgi:hypothetical protein
MWACGKELGDRKLITPRRFRMHHLKRARNGPAHLDETQKTQISCGFFNFFMILVSAQYYQKYEQKLF